MSPRGPTRQLRGDPSVFVAGAYLKPPEVRDAVTCFAALLFLRSAPASITWRADSVYELPEDGGAEGGARFASLDSAVCAIPGAAVVSRARSRGVAIAP